MIAGTVVFTIGLSLYPTAINYMAGGVGSKTYGSPTNWLVSIFTLAAVLCFQHYGKGIFKLASLLLGMGLGYVFSMFFGMVNFSNIGAAGFIYIPSVLHFGLTFEPTACIAMGLLFVINSIQAIGDFSATTAGGLNREPSTKELHGAILGYGVSNIVGALLGCLPTATYSQNVGIVSTTKVVNRATLGLAGVIILVAGLLPKFAALLTTVPYAVLGGATMMVFASIAVTGIKLITSNNLSQRDASVVGISVAIGMGVFLVPESLALFPTWVTTIFAKSPVVLSTLIAVFLNIVFPGEAVETLERAKPLEKYLEEK